MAESLAALPTLADMEVPRAELKIVLPEVRVWLANEPTFAVGGTVAVERRVVLGDRALWRLSEDPLGDFASALESVDLRKWEWRKGS